MVADVRIGSREVKLTNLDKVFFPALGLTKGDLIRYYLDPPPPTWVSALARHCHQLGMIAARQAYSKKR